MAEAKDIDRVKLLTGETNEELIEAYLEEAADFVKGYTNRSVIITPLEKAVRDLAVIAINRMGTEGETSRSEGGESYSFESAPRQIYDILNRYRLARVGGITQETGFRLIIIKRGLSQRIQKAVPVKNMVLPLPFPESLGRHPGRSRQSSMANA